MAHIGKLGPVAFRRDYNLNVNSNTNGWYRRYLGTPVFPPFVGDGGACGGAIFDIGPDFQNPGEIAWQSGLYHFGINFFQMELLVQIKADSSFLKQAILNVHGHGTILVWENTPDDHPRNPGFGSWGRVNVKFFSTDWFNPRVLDMNSDIFPKLWIDGPPH